MTKDTAEFSQLHAVACREYTLPREEASQPKGTPKLDPCWKLQGVEIRLMSLKQRQFSFPGQNFSRIKQVCDEFEEIPEVQLEEYALKLDAKDFASRSKAKAKPQRHICQLIHKNFSYWRKNLDRC